MNKFFTSLSVLMLTATAAMAEHQIVAVNQCDGYNSYVINYTSVAGDCVTPATVSGVITVPTANPMGAAVWVIDNHYTLADNASVPSIMGTTDAGEAGFSKNFVMIATDYLGYGVSVDSLHPYLCQRQNAINSIDLLKVALEILPANGIQPMALFNMGYSQGGGVTMAVHRELENMMTTDPVIGPMMLGLKGFASWCGAGPYDPVVTSQVLFDFPELVTMPVVIPMLVNGFLASAPAELRKEYKFSDFFTADLCTSRVLVNPLTNETVVYPGLEALIAAKVLDTTESSMLMVLAAGLRQDLAAFISADFLDAESQLHKDFFAWLELNNLLNGEWKPVLPLSLYHLDEDNVVTSQNAYLASEVLSLPEDRVHIYSKEWPGMEAFGSHPDFGTLFFGKVAEEIQALLISGPVGIQAVEEEVPSLRSTKRMENGRLIIRQGSKSYNALGIEIR